MKVPSNGYQPSLVEGARKVMSSELWHACAGPLVSLPPTGSLVVYFPQGHSEQVAASMKKDTQNIPTYPNLPSKLICMLQNVALHADADTDEVYAQMTLQPVNKYDQEALLISDMGPKLNKQPAEFFCKTLTASDTSTHGGFSVPRRAAEKIFPPLDFSMQPPSQELVARDLHDQSWTFRHIYRGQPKRHLLTTGWSVFVSSKRLCAGDAVLFIRDEKSHLLLGIRRANRQQPALSSSVISSDSMHIGILAAAAHAAANNKSFNIFFNPRASPAEFVIPLAKYNKAMYTQVSLGMRFRMMFETEESGVRRYMGTVTGTSDLDPARWKNSQWRSLQVGWDESTAGERPSRVSVWEIEPVVTPFYLCPPPFFRQKFPQQEDEIDIENAYKRGISWLDDFGMKDASSSIFPGLSLVQWMNMQQNHGISSLNTEDSSKLLSFQSPNLFVPSSQMNKPNQLVSQPSLQWAQQQHLQHLLHATSFNQQQPHLQPQQVQQQQIVHLQQQQNSVYTQLQQQNQQLQLQQQQQPLQQPNLQQVAGNTKPQNYANSANRVLVQSLAVSQESQFQHQLEKPSLQQLQHAPFHSLQPTFSPRQQMPQQSISEQQQSQKVQQMQQQLSSVSRAEPQSPLQQQLLQQTQQSKQPTLLHQQLSVSGNSFSTSSLLPSQPLPANHVQSQPRQLMPVRVRSGLTEGDAPSYSTPPSTNNCQELTNAKLAEPPKFKSIANEHLEPSTSITSHCLDAEGLQQNLLISTDGDIIAQIQTRNNFALAASIDSLRPDALLSRGFDSSFCGAPRDIGTDLSSAEIHQQSFGMPDMPFKPGCSNDVGVNDSGALGSGLWGSQTPCMRTYTKVRKRGSVGRTIDVTRYKGYEELRHDLAHMFGIEGQLEDAQRSEWKLVYVDHEKDILLVGDDPWEEFVGCVQSIKILSYSEVQQMSLDGDLGSLQVPLPVPNQASSGTDSGNPWKVV